VELLAPEGLEELIRRFGTFHDALIRKAEFRFSSNLQTSVRFELDAIQLPWVLDPATKRYLFDWKKVTIEIRALDAYRLELWKHYEGSIIFGLSIGWCGNLIYIDFDSDGEIHEEIDRSWTDVSLRFAVGDELWWEVTDFE
jgi:hypothetical protein